MDFRADYQTFTMDSEGRMSMRDENGDLLIMSNTGSCKVLFCPAAVRDITLIRVKHCYVTKGDRGIMFIIHDENVYAGPDFDVVASIPLNSTDCIEFLKVEVKDEYELGTGDFIVIECLSHRVGNGSERDIELTNATEKSITMFKLSTGMVKLSLVETEVD